MHEGEGRNVTPAVGSREDSQSLLPRSSDSTEAESYIYERPNHLNHTKRYWYIVHLLLLYSIIIATTTALVVRGSRKSKDPSLASYSPAQRAVTYKTITLTPSKYQGPPTPERNDMWRDLHHRGVVTRVSPEEARGLLVNNSFVLKNGDHTIELEMFHQLHCLDTIRFTLYSAEYPAFSPYGADGKPKNETFTHLDHCVDRLLQGIMCASNIGAAAIVKDAGAFKEGVPFEQRLKIDPQPIMTCRNFEEVQQWAFDREVKGWQTAEEGGIKLVE
ncbi:hypothetical protein HD806DRAFT_525732 [Xylariaceae sp. AK1471]|nr:hypothetical protein HD806DRAFT_525732 [Xylariaceae sp. AK1471]